VTIGQAVRLTVPSVATPAAIGLQGESALAAARRKHDDGSTRSTTAPRIICSADVRAGAICGQSCSARETESADKDDAAAGCPAAGLGVSGRVVSSACPTATAQGNAVNRCGEYSSTFTTRT
jgi:hypothetical protein